MVINKDSFPWPRFSFRAHPWHGVTAGDQVPFVVNSYIEMVPTDTVKYELDKETGLLRVDRPQQFSSYCPGLYGFIPQTYCGQRVGSYKGPNSMKEEMEEELQGDGDPMDICVLTEKAVGGGDLLVKAIPIGGLRMVDQGQADDKIIAVLAKDFIYGEIKDIQDCPKILIDRLRHYFLTYKECPGEITPRKVSITCIYGAEEARTMITLSQLDYQDHVQTLMNEEEGKGK